MLLTKYFLSRSKNWGMLEKVQNAALYKKCKNGIPKVERRFCGAGLQAMRGRGKVE